MSFTIAIAGKGGAGKTTLAALIVGRLIAQGRHPVLAVDADPNMCLDEALGVKVTRTVGGTREETRRIAGKGISSGISKQQLLEMAIAGALVESEGYDLIAMGRPEGPGCYCYANNVLKEAIQKLSNEYPYVVIDNEAGLENLSRRIIRKVDLMILVSDPSHRGLETVSRLYRLAEEMEVRYDRMLIVVNRLRDSQLPKGVERLRAETGAELVFALPEDGETVRASERGECILDLHLSNPLVARITELLDLADLPVMVR